MRQPEENSPGGARRRKAQLTKTARLATVVSQAGKPEVYLPLFDPTKDRSFMRAVREHRVLSIRQDPTSKHQDYGTVGFDTQGHFTYLVFPKSLKEFVAARVVGIKYDKLKDSSPVVGAAPRAVKMPKARLAKSARPAAKVVQAPKPPKRAEPQSKNFRVRVRVTIVTERDVTVTAMTKAEAKKKAQAEQSGEGKVRVMRVSEA